MDKFTDGEIDAARQMAEVVNGGSWDTHYTAVQKIGWCLKVRWAAEYFLGKSI